MLDLRRTARQYNNVMWHNLNIHFLCNHPVAVRVLILFMIIGARYQWRKAAPMGKAGTPHETKKPILPHCELVVFVVTFDQAR
jgi:hypothetical protein